MAHFLTELYSPKPAWLALDQDGRNQLFMAIGEGMDGLSALGIKPIALGKIDAHSPHAPAHGYFAIWSMPDEAARNALVSGIAGAGWHDYFETINAGGAGVDLNGHLAELAAL